MLTEVSYYKFGMRLLTILLFILFSKYAEAQYFNGYISSDFSGIIGARLHPAAIANSPYKYDVSLLNGNFYYTNNISYLTKNNNGDRGFRRLDDSQMRFAHVDMRVGGMSALLSLKNRSAIGIQYQLRGAISGINITPDFVQQFGRFQTVNFANQLVTDQKGDIATSFWHEVGLTYALILSENVYSRWKAGATFKFVNPVANAILRLENMDYEVTSDGTAIINTIQSQVAYSSNLNSYEPFDGNEPIRFPSALGFTPAFDIGFSYESVLYRDDPKAENLTSYYPDILYEHKFSMSVTDIGLMTFEYGSASFNILDVLPSNGTIDFDNLLSGVSSVRELQDSLATITDMESLSGSYTVSMPTALNISYDYNWKNNWYFNIAGQFDVSRLMNTDYRMNYPNSMTITPRYESGFSGLYFPIYINFEGDVELGTAIRYGPVSIGTQSLGSLFSSEKKSAGVFFSINLRQLKANSQKPYCFGKSKRTGSAGISTQRKPLYKRKSLF